MFKASVYKLYESLEKQISKKDFEGKNIDEVFQLVWELFSDYTNTSKNEENKFIEHVISKVDEFFDRG